MKKRPTKKAHKQARVRVAPTAPRPPGPRANVTCFPPYAPGGADNNGQEVEAGTQGVALYWEDVRVVGSSPDHVCFRTSDEEDEVLIAGMPFFVSTKVAPRGAH